MSIVATGQLAIDPRKTVTRYSRSNGWQTVYTWQGTEAQCQAKMLELVASRLFEDIELDPGDGVLHTLTASTGRPPFEQQQGEVPEIDVKMKLNRVSKDILEHEDFIGCTAAQRAAIRASINGNGKEVTGLPADAAILYEWALRGVRHFTVYQPTILVTLTASGAYQFEVAYSNSGKIISTDYLAEEAGITGFLRFTLPTDLSPPDGYAYGWLKHYPEYDVTTGGRYQLTVEYEYGLWPTAIYGTLVS